MPEKEKPTLIERLTQLILREALGGITKPAERFAKRIARSVGLILAGIVISLIGVAFLAVGVVRWLSVLMPSWLAWLIVGIFLVLMGIAVTLGTFVSGRS